MPHMRTIYCSPQLAQNLNTRATVCCKFAKIGLVIRDGLPSSDAIMAHCAHLLVISHAGHHQLSVHSCLWILEASWGHCTRPPSHTLENFSVNSHNLQTRHISRFIGNNSGAEYLSFLREELAAYTHLSWASALLYSHTSKCPDILSSNSTEFIWAHLKIGAEIWKKIQRSFYIIWGFLSCRTEVLCLRVWPAALPAALHLSDSELARCNEQKCPPYGFSIVHVKPCSLFLLTDSTARISVLNTKQRH